PVPDAVEGMLRGVARALGSIHTATAPGIPWSLERITLVEYHARRLLPIAEALQKVGDQLREERLLDIEYALTPADREEYRQGAKGEEKPHLRGALEKLEREEAGPPAAAEVDPAPPRLTFSLAEGVYTFGAVTSGAAIPERAVEVNTTLVNQ